MNQDKIQYILIGILMAGMFAIGLGVYVMGQQIQMISGSIKTIEQGMNQQTKAPVTQPTSGKIAVEKYCDKVEGTTGLCFDYPKGWIVTLYNDQFTSGQKNLQIEDSSTGIRVTIEKLQADQSGMKGPRVSGYGYLYELGEMCSGEECPMDQYYLQYGDNADAFAIRAFYKVANYNAEVPVIKSYINTILSSFENGQW